MNRKKFIISALIVCIGFAGSFLLMNAKNRNDNTVKEGTSLKTNTEKTQEKIFRTDSQSSSASQLKRVSSKDKKSVAASKENNDTIKANLFNNASGDMLPLSAINIMSELPKDINSKILKIAESSNIYMIQKNHDKLLIITENPANIRHNIEFTEI